MHESRETATLGLSNRGVGCGGLVAYIGFPILIITLLYGFVEWLFTWGIIR